jgi:hypothetical protein
MLWSLNSATSPTTAGNHTSKDPAQLAGNAVRGKASRCLQRPAPTGEDSALSGRNPQGVSGGPRTQGVQAHQKGFAEIPSDCMTV